MPGKLLCRRTTRGAQAALALAILLAATTLAPSQAPGAATPAGAEMRVADAAAVDLGAGTQAPGEAIVRYEPGVAPAERRRARARAAVELGERLELPRAELVEVEGSVQAAIRRLERQPGIAYAQPNYRYEALADPPNDTFFNELWGLDDPALPDPGVSAVEAWNSSTGVGQVIAVLDTGVDLTHPDIAANLWVNPTPGPDVHGYDFVDDNGNPDDYQFHGTHVAATAAAIAGNGEGIAGVAPGAEIMSVRVLDGDGSGFTSDIAAGIVYAAERGADVINLSLGGPAGSDKVTEDAVTLAAVNSAVVVAAAGNDGSDNDMTPQMPCNLPQANLICVAALDRSGAIAGFSNFGAESVDLAAPGTSILSAKPSYGGPIFSEDFESGYAAWATSVFNGGVPWGPSSGPPGSNHVTDSPGGKYGSAEDSKFPAISELFTAGPVDLSGERGCRNHFRTRYQIQDPAQNGALRDAFAAGAAAGTDPIDLRFFAGTSDGFSQGTFLRREASISELDDRSDVEPLFAILSDGSIELDGAYVDDIRLICRDDSYVNAITAFANWDNAGSGSYFNLNGTSMATPHVAGVVALVRSAAPGLSLQQQVDAVLDGASPTPVPDSSKPTATFGIADACQAVAIATGGDVEAECPASGEPSAPPPPTEGGPSPSVQEIEDAIRAANVASSPTPAIWVPPSRLTVFFGQRPPRMVRTKHRRAKVVFRFGSNERPVRFVCRLNGGPWRFCKARFVKRLRVGRHVVRVKARDAAGNTTPRPAVHRFRIIRVGRR